MSSFDPQHPNQQTPIWEGPFSLHWVWTAKIFPQRRGAAEGGISELWLFWKLLEVLRTEKGDRLILSKFQAQCLPNNDGDSWYQESAQRFSQSLAVQLTTLPPTVLTPCGPSDHMSEHPEDPFLWTIYRSEVQYWWPPVARIMATTSSYKNNGLN